MRKNISVTNKRVLEAFDSVSNVSKLIEDAVLHYLDTADNRVVTKEDVRAIVKEMLFEFIGTMKLNEVSFKSQEEDLSCYEDDIKDILNIC